MLSRVLLGKFSDVAGKLTPALSGFGASSLGSLSVIILAVYCDAHGFCNGLSREHRRLALIKAFNT